MQTSRTVCALTLALLACSCGKTSVDPNTSTAPATAAASSVDRGVTKSGLWFSPEALSACETNALVTVRWNVHLPPGAKGVNVFTVRANGEEAMFARHARPAGAKRTGRWIRSGREFVLRDATAGTELARAAVGTTSCAPTATQDGN